jgi:integrase
MYSYLLNRRGHFHVRIRVPADISSIIPHSELVKSLKTKDEQIAQQYGFIIRQRIIKTFSLFRLGILTGDQVGESIHEILGRKSGESAKLAESAVIKHQHALQPTQSMCSNEKLLSSVMDDFVSDRHHDWSVKTKMENEASLRLLLDVVGDVDIRTIGREVVRGLRDNLSVLPANLYKLYPQQTAIHVLELVRNGGEVTPMSTTSVNKHLSRFSGLLSHSVKEGHLMANPAEGISIKQKRRADEERKVYTPDDMKKIVGQLLLDDGKPERFWLPLIAMLSGLRLDEACQLYTEDVKMVGGVWCFDVNEEGDKKLKNVSSARIVPVHPSLIGLGLLEYVEQGRAGGRPRLWMNLQRRDADGYGSAYGKVFQRFNRKYITTDPLKTFHSFRHAFADTLKQLGEQESLIAELMGHANSSITTGRYGKRYQPLVLLEAVRKLDFGVPVRELKQD